MLPQTHESPRSSHADSAEDCITIIAPSVAEAMKQFRDQGLDKLGYAIVGKVMRQRISIADEQGRRDLFDGQSMFTATWVRSAQS